MISNVDLLEAHPEDHEYPKELEPNFEGEFVHAKSFLQKGSTLTGENLYDHLTEVLNKILQDRPENVVDFFEEYSRKVKEKRFRPLTDHLEDIFIEPGKYKQAIKLMSLLAPLPPEEPSTLDPDDRELADMSKNNLMELLYYFEHAGVGLPRMEMCALTLSMRKLIHQEPIAKIRFWGKIFGIDKNYIVVETILKDEEYVKRNETYQIEAEAQAQAVAFEATDVLNQQLEDIAKQQEVGGENDAVVIPWPTYPPLPKNAHEEPKEPPSEPSGVGANKYVYYICNEPGDAWTQLPDVTPKQIRMSRKIYRSFTGTLNQPVISYPAFPGDESNYLRAQIARISASTQISPLGFFTFGVGGGEDEEMDEEEEAGSKTEYRENPKYDSLPLKDLIDRSMIFWVHHGHHILEQGRSTWWNPNPLPEGIDEELGEDEEEAKPMIVGAEPETGPPLLTPCSEDVNLDAIPAWSVRCSSGIQEEYAVAVVRSNFWPGAYCFATQGKLFQNIYLGGGLKIACPNFSPTPLPNVEQDYELGPEIMEIVDPTGAEEEEWRIAHLPKEKPPMELKGEEEEAGEEEEDEDEDEDDD